MRDMMCYGHERRRRFWIFIPFIIAAAVFIFGFVVMQLWNALLPVIFGIHTITFWQAIGIIILSKILFGGFRGGHGHHRGHAHWNEMREKWMQMTPEEREKRRKEWWKGPEPEAKPE